MGWDSQAATHTDQAFPGSSAALSLIHARILLLLDVAPHKPYSNVEQHIVGILSNANTTIHTAYQLWRNGRLLQTGILLRNSIEASAFAVQLHSEPTIHSQYLSGQLSSTKAIAKAAKVLGPTGPNIKEQYDELSKHFVHIGPLQRASLTWHIDIRKDKIPLQVVLLDLKWAYYLLEVCAEFCLFHRMSDGRYWRRSANHLAFEPTAEAEKWLSGFIEKDIDEVQKALQKGGSIAMPTI
ncbi:MAG: hypothetical protein C5B47_05110 [Verrucomicrobia bacterium]|nr:MAG: hypothetical protein C5B47_05110 [Verrucomicrobiota bacterium]